MIRLINIKLKESTDFALLFLLYIPDEKEKFDRVAFCDAVLPALDETEGDLDQVSYVVPVVISLKE